jgi:hypothetical protein
MMADTQIARKEPSPRPTLRMDDSKIRWMPFGHLAEPNPDGSHPSDGLTYWVLGVNRARQTVDILFKQDAGVRCRPHRHVGPTDTMVLEGQHNNFKYEDGKWKLVQERPPGFLAYSEGDHFHIEQGGPEGTIVHLHMVAVDGLIWEVLARDNAVVASARIEDFQAVLDYQNGKELKLREGSSL